MHGRSGWHGWNTPRMDASALESSHSDTPAIPRACAHLLCRNRTCTVHAASSGATHHEHLSQQHAFVSWLSLITPSLWSCLLRPYLSHRFQSVGVCQTSVIAHVHIFSFGIMMINPELEAFARAISRVLGWAYFLAWSVPPLLHSVPFLSTPY